MRILFASVVGSAAFLAAAPAPAAEEYSTKETRALMHAYARCVVGREGEKASEALLANVDNGTILRRYRMLIIGDCLRVPSFATTQMSFTGDLYRYALADALVNREFAAKPAPQLENVALLQHREPGEEPKSISASGKKLSTKKYQEQLEDYREGVAYNFLSRYGECVVRLNPEGAKALVLTAPDSDEEAARFQGLQTALGTCLPEGETLRFGKVALRGTIAINYYRLAHAAALATAGTPS